MHDDAFDHGPRKARRLDQSPALHHFVKRPGAAIIEMVKCGDDAGSARLARMGQRHGIVGAKPAPGLFHEANAYTTQICRASKLSYNITKVVY